MLPGVTSPWPRTAHEHQLMLKSPQWWFSSCLSPLHYFTWRLLAKIQGSPGKIGFGARPVTLHSPSFLEGAAGRGGEPGAGGLLACLIGTLLNCSPSGVKTTESLNSSHSLTVQHKFCRVLFELQGEECC